MKNDKIVNIVKIVVFTAIIFIFPIITFIQSPSASQVLEYEARTRTRFTQPTLDGILNNTYQREFESYFNDNFAFREDLLKAKTFADINISKKYLISDVIFSANKEKLFRYRPIKQVAAMQRQKNELQAWKEANDYMKSQNIPFIVIGIPDQSDMFYDQYPSFAYNNEERYKNVKQGFFANLDEMGIDYIDANELLYGDREKYYFKTDHHHNFEAEIKIYDALIEKINKNYFPMENMMSKLEILETPYEFVGSHTRKLFELVKENKRLKYAVPKEDIPFVRHDYDLIIDPPYINKISKHYFFMNGDKSITTIETNRKDLKNILVIGDSTSNPLESIIWTNANKMTSIDFRYEDKNTINGLVEFLKKNPQDLVIVSLMSFYYDNPAMILK